MKRWTAFLAGSLGLLYAGLASADTVNWQQALAEARIQDEPVTHEWRHKLTWYNGHGPENTRLGEPHQYFYSLAYEPVWIGYWPEKNWPSWQAYVRGRLAYDALKQHQEFSENRSSQADGWNAELREFYLRGHLLTDASRFSLTLGRQRFTDQTGLWWDDLLEAVRLDYQGAYWRSFVAVGQKFHYYNTAVNRLDVQDRDRRYWLGETAWQWRYRHWFGLRFLHEQDRGGVTHEDRNAFEGWRYGLFWQAQQLDSVWVSDYRLQAAFLEGDAESLSAVGKTMQERSGWAVEGELARRFPQQAWQPRWALHAGMTDRPANAGDGFYLNALQSDRLSMADYSTRLVSPLLRLNLQNVSYYGLGLALQPSVRQWLDLRVTHLQLRDAQMALPIRAAASGEGNVLGQVADLTYVWRSFPRRYQQRLFSLQTVLQASYFHAGNAVEDLQRDYQVSLSVSLNF